MLARKALAGTAGTPKLYVEDVFSTYLYTGNGSTQTITNNIDLSGKGGLVWIKSRNNVDNHYVFDTERGSTKRIYPNLTSAEASTNSSTYLSSFNSDGFSLGYTLSDTNWTYASWTFRKAKKFFDVVTYTGNGTAGRTVSHNLGSVPGCIIVKCTTVSGYEWTVYHTSNGNTKAQLLNSTAAASTSTTYWNNTDPTSTNFTVGTSAYTNFNGETYVAYLFAHDAGGFGDAGSDNVISCGSFTTNGSGYFDVNLGYEPQWLLFKKSSGTGDWFLADNMRGMGVQALTPPMISANTSAAETTANGGFFYINSTGFGKSNNADLGANSTYIYIAIRRGPMKTPTTGTSVFSPVAQNAGSTVTTNFPVDLTIVRERAGVNDNHAIDRLRGDSTTSYNYLLTNTTAAEVTGTGAGLGFDNNTGFKDSLFSGTGYIYWNFHRAPGFFDVVCYTGTGSATTISHNLGVVPEMMIVKRRNTTNDWIVYHSTLSAGGFAYLNLTNAGTTSGNTSFWNGTTPTSSVFSIGTANGTNASGSTYVAYLFASLSGVSKVGSYTGNGSSVTVTTDFQPRFVMVKRYDSTGNWIVGDSARGLVSADEPALFLNSTAAETTGQDWVDVSSTGFTVNETALNANVNTATYLYLAVA